MRELKNIIVVDDESGVLLALKLLMQTLGLNVQDFPGGEPAIEHIKSGASFDLIICDLRMPKADGMAVLRSAVEHKPDAPFILMSGHATTEEVEKARGLGAFGFLPKPFTAQDLKNIVEKAAKGERCF